MNYYIFIALNNIISTPSPQPAVSFKELKIRDASFQFKCEDYGVSYLPFLSYLPDDLRNSKSVIETNRCFFLHLGIATSTHPFLLQTAIRCIAFIINKKLKEGNFTIN